MPQKRLDGTYAPETVYDTDPTRAQARKDDPTLEAWIRASASLAGKAQAAKNRGDMATCLVYRHLAKVAANAREQRYVSWLLKAGKL